MTIHYHVKTYMDRLAITGAKPIIASIFIKVSSRTKQVNLFNFNSAGRKSADQNDVIMDGVHPLLPFIIASPLDTGFSLHRLDVSPLLFSDDVVLVECGSREENADRVSAWPYSITASSPGQLW